MDPMEDEFHQSASNQDQAKQLSNDLRAAKDRIEELERDVLLLADKLTESERERRVLLARAQALEAAKDAELRQLIAKTFPEMMD